MAAGAKLQKSFQDYFRIPILLRSLGNTSQQTLISVATVFNQIGHFPINDHSLSLNSTQHSISKQKIKKSPNVYERLRHDISKRGNQQSYKLLFVSEEFDNDWSQLEIVYRVSFVILVYSGQETHIDKQPSTNRSSIDSPISSPTDLNEKIQKISTRLRQKDKQLLGIIFLNDTKQFSKSLTPQIKFTIVPPTLPLQQLPMFIEPWMGDLIPLIEKNFLQHILQCKYQDNSIIVFNRSQDKSQPKIMKRKKKFRCLKICGDLALMLHLYNFAYQSYHQADEQLRKVDDWLWVLGCVQGKLACMSGNAQLLNIREEDIQKRIQQLISESFIYSKKVKYQSFQIENTFKIMKLLLHEDKQRFDSMVEDTLAGYKGLTQEDKFIYYSYIGSLYEKAGMQRKRNYYYFKASLIIEKFKPQISELFLKTIKNSRYIQQWEELNSKVIQKIIQGENHFEKNAELHLELIQQCSTVLTPKQIESIKEYLNYGNFQEKVVQSTGDKLIELKEFRILQSETKPKPNRLITDQSPKKTNVSGIFVGWKRKLTYLYEDQQPITFAATILNKLPFEIRLKVSIELVNSSQTIPEFSLILPPSQLHKFTKQISFTHTQQPISIKQIKFSIWNFVLYKTIQPQISFELYEKQPQFEVQIEGGEKIVDEKQKIKVETEQSSYLCLRCNLRKKNTVQCDRLRVTCSVYYDIDVGFQQNQCVFSTATENNFFNIDLQNTNNTPNLKFLESDQKESSVQFDQTEKIVVLKLKKFKATRNHIKKLQINLDYIRDKTSKYQLNKQYIIEPKMLNSVWAEIIQISTPELQSSLQNMKNLSNLQTQQFCQKWTTIEDKFLARIRFYKDNFNLKPFKVWCNLEENKNDIIVLGKNEVILSNLTQGEMWIQLNKVKATFIEKEKILLNLPQNEKGMKDWMKPLSFSWENIVNKNMQGSINIMIPPNPLLFAPKLEFSINVQKQEQQPLSTATYCRVYRLIYTITGQQGEEVKPHKVSIKTQNQIQPYQSPSTGTQSNQNENSANQGSTQGNVSILIKGKTKINKISNKQVKNQIRQKSRKSSENNSKNIFENTLTLRVIKQKLNENIDKEKDAEVPIVVTIEFDQKQIGKWQQTVKLI